MELKQEIQKLKKERKQQNFTQVKQNKHNALLEKLPQEINKVLCGFKKASRIFPRLFSNDPAHGFSEPGSIIKADKPAGVGQQLVTCYLEWILHCSVSHRGCPRGYI